MGDAYYLRARAGVVGVKDSSRGFVHVMEYLQALPPSATVICGKDSYILPAFLMGARGAITGYANALPEVYARPWKSYKSGNVEEAPRLQFRVNNHCKLLQKPTISPHYESLQLRGIDCGNPRAPLRAMTDNETHTLKEQLENLTSFKADYKEHPAIALAGLSQALEALQRSHRISCGLLTHLRR